MPTSALILAHHAPTLLARLVRRLSQIGIASYVHIDARVDQHPFEEACRGQPCTFIPVRHVVYWSGYSTIEAVLSLARAALADGSASRFLHISGDTYPIKPDRELLAAIEQDADFISLHENGPQTQFYRRIARTYLPDSRLGFMRLHPSHDDRFITPDLMANWAEIAKVDALKSTTEFPWRFAVGSNWWCLRRATLERCLRIIETNPDVILWFRYSSNPEESLFHTIILNGGQSARPGPVYLDWSREAKPHVFETAADALQLLKSDLPFARKFSDRSGELLDLIDYVSGVGPRPESR